MEYSLEGGNLKGGWNTVLIGIILVCLHSEFDLNIKLGNEVYETYFDRVVIFLRDSKHNYLIDQ